MTSMKRPRLTAIKLLAGKCLRLIFVDGSVFSVDFTPLIEEAPGLAPLRDAKVFANATIETSAGWSVEWPACDIQIGADTLWLDAQAQNAPDENTRIFIQWRLRHGLSLKAAAAALGMTPRTMSAYGTGARPVPRYVALACRGWEAEHGAA